MMCLPPILAGDTKANIMGLTWNALSTKSAHMAEMRLPSWHIFAQRRGGSVEEVPAEEPNSGPMNERAFKDGSLFSLFW
jgi:hypothetical protein